MREHTPQHTLLTEAEALLNKGLSVIPVRGGSNTETAKIAAVRWSEYTKRFATHQEVNNWFSIQGFRGIAIVCGRLSQLAVLDFDDQSTYNNFAQRFPHLTDTYTIQSAIRQTPHLYWRIDFTVYGTTVHGGELRAEGQYIVTAPTAIGQQHYRVTNNAPIRPITPQELNEALTTLKPNKQYTQPQLDRDTKDIITLYKEAAPNIGRNNALYQTSRCARDNGWTLTEALEELTPLHIEQNPSWKHKAETASARRKEATNTIQSAFKQRKTSLPKDTKGLPNSIREKLIETQKTSITARLLDTLKAGGIETFTEAQATQIAKASGIGRHSVIRTLTGNLSQHNTDRIFPIVTEKNMMCSATKGVKTYGRRPQVYRVPDNSYLYALFEVPHSSSDPIHTDDLSSGKHYRLALHRNLIQRRPAAYARQWLAKRLGVSARSVQRYNKILDVQVTPVYGYSALKDNATDRLPLTDERLTVTPGRWLEDTDGKRYPALRVLAHKLLKDKRTAHYVRQLPNHYQLNAVSNDDFPKALWRCMKCHKHSDKPLAQCSCHTQIPERVGQVEAKIDMRECIHCGQLCFDGKLVCVHCRHKREQPAQRIWFDKDGKPHFPIRYERILLTREEVRHLLPDDFQRSLEVELPDHKAWLETPDGTRYPTIQGLAYRLIKKYGEVFLVKRDHTAEMFYTLGTFFLKHGSRKLGLHFLRRAGIT
jgi:hypothetical protein